MHYTKMHILLKVAGSPFPIFFFHSLKMAQDFFTLSFNRVRSGMKKRSNNVYV